MVPSRIVDVLHAATASETQASTPHTGFPDEQPVPPMALGHGGELADLGGVGPRNHESELHAVILAPIERSMCTA